MTEQTNYFEKMNKVNVSEHIEKKGKFSYLSWPFAVQQLGLADPTATWEVVKHNGLPYLKTECGVFVEVSVTVQGTKKTQIHPVLNGQNRPIAEPNAFDINTSIQRCLVKAIALHGLGLYIFAGEDLPEGEEDATKDALKKEFPSGQPVLSGPHKPTGDAYALLSPDMRIFINDLDTRVRTLGLKTKPDIAGACDEVDEALMAYDNKNDLKVALWDRMGDVSALRNKMKTEWQSRKVAA